MLSDFLEYGFLQRALLAGVLAAVSCGLLSPFIVLRRMAFIGHGLSHAAFGGAALALLVGMNLSLGAALFAGLLAVVLAIWTRRGELTEDSAIGILLAASMAIGVIALAMRKRYTQDVMSYLFGNILAVLPGDLLMSVIAASLTIGCALFFFRPLASATFHEDLAKIEGVPVERMRMILFLLIALNVVAAMKLVGAILVSALLVVPGAMALFVSRRLIGVQIASLAIGVIAVLLGLAVSYALDLPSGAVIALILFLGTAVARGGAFLARRYS